MDEVADPNMFNPLLHEGSLYTPLERPVTTTIARPSVSYQDTDSDEHDVSSSDLDSDELQEKKKVKNIKRKDNPSFNKSTHNSKRNKWSEDMTDENLCNSVKILCGMYENDRDIESYDYKLGMRNARVNKNYKKDDHSLKKPVHKHNKNKKHDSQKFQSLNFGNRTLPRQRKGKIMDRALLELAVSPFDSVQSVAKDIAEKLYETNSDLIIKITEIIGAKRAIEIYNETKEIEGKGGMYLSHHKRRRTSGGVFFTLVKRENSEELQNMLHKENRQHSKRSNRLKMLKRKKVRDSIPNGSNVPVLSSRIELECDVISDDLFHKEMLNPPPSPETFTEEGETD